MVVVGGVTTVEGTIFRRFFRSNLVKFFAFVLAVGFLTAGFGQLVKIGYNNLSPELLVVKDYQRSTDYEAIINMAVYNSTYENIQDNAYYYFYGDKKAVTNMAFLKNKNINAKEFDSLKVYMKKINKDAFYERNGGLIVIKESYIKKMESDWQKKRVEASRMYSILGIELILAIIFVIYLMMFSDRKHEDDIIHLTVIEKIYTDIILFAFLISIGLWIVAIRGAFSHGGWANQSLVFEKVLSFTLLYFSCVIAFSVFGILFLSLVRKFKAGILIKHSFIYVVLYKIYDFFKSLFDGRAFDKFPLTKSLFYRQLVFISGSFMMVLFFLIFAAGVNTPFSLVFPAFEIIIVYWYIKGNNETFKDINKGFNESLEEQMKAERMKIALVTNVSHDLKTPLTSIISYADLLSKEQNLSETASDYVKILVDKSNRLKTIVADLFDLAKSNSGNISLDLESLDIKKLIEQTLGDMEDHISESDLVFKVKLPDRPVMIKSDGKKLYRVFQNVVDNTLKYSLNGTRVFVELEVRDGMAIASIKNTASYEMDFTSEEILQRFSRGDKARTSEGSGLGLSIAESFTHVSGGDFKVDIDGDLFKVTIMFGVEK